jgi:uncharacterized membrane protein YesL
VVSKANPARRGRAPGPLRLAVTRTIEDWWYGLIPFAVLNLTWLILVVTVVAGPPATAALLGVARDAAIGQGVEPSNFFFYLRRLFWRAWALGLVSALGTIIFVTDLFFYADRLSGNPFLMQVGIFFLLYVLIVWLEFLLIAWPLLVNQPDMEIRHVVRNSAIIALRTPGANFGLALLVIFLAVLCIFLAPFVGLALAAFVSLLAQHYLHIQVPILANFPTRPGEGSLETRAESGATE